MLNVAWLNGATPLGKGGGASSGGSGSGEDTYQYYRIDRSILDGFLPLNTLPFIVLAKGIYDVSNSHLYGTKIIGSFSNIGAAMSEQIMCYNGKVIIGDKEINNGDWKKNICEYIFTFSGPYQDDHVSIQKPEDVLKHLEWLIPITKEEFYSLDNDNDVEG